MTSSSLVLYGKYQLLELLARGGMAEVFKAKSYGVEGFEKILVIKRILPELSAYPEFVEMFVNEAKIAVTLSHANIVQVFDLGKAEDSYFIAMEYVAGMDLAAMFALAKQTGRAFTPELAAFVVSELAKALDYAHRRRDASFQPLNIVHRDVSPPNVLVSWEGEVKLTDFGIAKARHVVDETSRSYLKGKYAYMAPEQARGEDVDLRADIFALGTLLYETLTGENPFFVSNAPEETLQRVRACDPTPLSVLAPELPEELVAIVEHMMSPVREHRQPNAGTVYEELIQYLYASERRVGAHDLSEFVTSIRTGSQVAALRLTQADAQIRAAFTEESAAYTQGSFDETSVQSAASPRRVTRRPAGARTSIPNEPAVAAPSSEKRDVTLLAVALGALASDNARADVLRIARHYGGIELEDGVFADGDEVSYVYCLFGAQHTDGRDTEAAARAALGIQRTLGAKDAFSAPQAALQIGRVFVDADGLPVVDERYELLVSEASALLKFAPLGRTAMADDTSQTVRSRFHTEIATEVSQPNLSFLLAERPYSETYGKFVGRKDELRLIGDAFTVANRARLKVLAITGEAGSGKSRLLHETVRRLDLGNHDVGVYHAVIPASGRASPLSGIAEMLRVIIGADDFDDVAGLVEKTRRLRELGLTPPEVEAVAGLLGIRPVEEGADRSNALRAALLRVATKLSQDRLSVFAFDGVESMDDESQAMLDALLSRAAETRIVVILAGRLGAAQRWAELPSFEEVRLRALTDEEVRKLVESRLKSRAVPQELVSEILTKSAGNPLFVEEYLSALSAAGAVEMRDGALVYRAEVAEIEVPKSLRGLVASRVARLDALSHLVLQIMAIAASRVSPELVAKVAEADVAAIGASLQLLENRNFVAKSSSGEYQFAHEVVSEVLRDGLAVDTRRTMHRALALAFESVLSSRLDELSEQMATHWREAGDRARAVDYLERAATKRESAYELGPAVANLARAITFLSQMPSPDRDRMLAMYRRIGDLALRGRVLDTGVALIRDAVELAESLDRDTYVARFSIMHGRLLVHATKLDEGRRWLDRGRDLAKRLGDRELVRDAALAMAEGDSRNGQNVRTLASLREALEISREMGDVAAQIRCLVPLALAFGQEGDGTAGLNALKDARRLAGDEIDRYTESDILKMESLVHYYSRDYLRCIGKANEAMEIAMEYGFEYEIAVNSHNIGETYIRLGDFRRAFASLQRSYEICREKGYQRLLMMNQRALGFIDAIRNQPNARERVVEAVRFADSNGFLWDAMQGKYMLAIVDHQRGDLDAARTGLREMLRLAADNGQRRYVMDAENALAAIERGDPVPSPS